MTLWRVEIRLGRRRPWWDTVVQNSEPICREAFAKTRERVPRRHLRLLDAAGQAVAEHAPACWRTPYQVWSRCNGPAHGEAE